MIEIRFDASESYEYKFQKTRSEEIVQNVENILSRVKGNVVLNREKGIDADLIDNTFGEIEAYMSAVIMEEIERDEPRFSVIEIDYDKTYHSVGKFIVIVRGVIKDE